MMRGHLRPSRISTTLAAARSRDLTDLATIKAELDINAPNAAGDAVLMRYIAEASAAIENYCNRVVAVETVRDDFFLPHDVDWTVIDGSDALQLSRWPLISISAATMNGGALTLGVDYALDAESGLLFRNCPYSGARQRWPAGRAVVEYSAGYDSIPADIAGAAIQLVKWRWMARTRDPSVRSETVEGVYSAAYLIGTGRGGPGDMLVEVADRIDRYRSIIVG